MARKSADQASPEPKTEVNTPPHHDHRLPFHRHNGQVTPWIKPDGESYRKGIDPVKFLKICSRSSSRVSAAVNVLWPAVPAAMALHWARPEWHLAIFIVNYIAMVPAANLIGFAGQELARKLPKVFGVILETTLGSVVEIILFIVLIASIDNGAEIIKAAILGSILANLLLCLGLCFFVGGMLQHEQTFHEAVSEVGSGLMLVAGMGLVIPTAFASALAISRPGLDVTHEVLKISRATAILLLCAFFVYVWFQMRSHHGIYDEILEQDELKDRDRHKDLKKDKLTFTECIVALLIALTCVALIADFLVNEIFFIVQSHGVSDAFMGLILVPLVEKAAEHLTAVDEAHDNQMNFALSHVLGASIQTALLSTPIVVIVGWGIGKVGPEQQMDLSFQAFDAIVLILAILVVGGFLRDGKSNYLEGSLCIIVYIMIAIGAFFYPNPEGEEGGEASEGGEANSTSTAEPAASASAEAAKMAVRMLARSAGVDL